jgi:hypothetical protein
VVLVSSQMRHRHVTSGRLGPPECTAAAADPSASSTAVRLQVQWHFASNAVNM